MSPEYNDWNNRIRKRSGPQYMNADGSISGDRPSHLRPLPPPPPRERQGIHLSEEAAKRIADAIKIFLREPPKRRH
jgi:hypothetical protein